MIENWAKGISHISSYTLQNTTVVKPKNQSIRFNKHVVTEDFKIFE